MKKSRKIFSISFKIIGIFLICIGFSLLISNLKEDYSASESSSIVLEEVKNIAKENDDFIDGVPDYLSTPKMELPTVSVGNNEYIGTLKMETIDIELPILSEWDFSKLRIAPARYKGSPYLSNFIIAAHNYKSHFKKISNLNIGDKVVFEDLKGNSFKYEVILKETIPQEDIEKMEDGNWDMTLFTCTRDTKSRVTIRLRKIDTY